jgi:hypothetical protein
LRSAIDTSAASDLFDLHCFPDGEDRDQQRKKSDANKEYICEHFLSNEAHEKNPLEVPVVAAMLASDIYIRTVLTVVFAHINKSLSQGSKIPIKQKTEAQLKQQLARVVALARQDRKCVCAGDTQHSHDFQPLPQKRGRAPTIVTRAVAGRARPRRAGGNDAYAMDAVCRRRHCPRYNDADGGRAMTRNQR